MSPLIELVTVAIGSAAALTGLAAARLTADRPVRAISLALGGYALLAIPAATAMPVDRGPVVVVMAVLGDLTAAALIGAGIVAVLMAVRGRTRRLTGARAAMVAGGLTLAVAHVAHRVTTTAAVAPWFAGARLATLVVVLGGAIALVRRCMAQLDTVSVAHDEELRLAELRLARATERNHELRTGLAGLAGAASLLGDGPSDAALRGVVASELTRLDHLLQTPVDAPPERPATAYDVGPVLAGLAVLRAPAVDIRTEVEPGLRAVGSSRTLAQVVTNLIANAERHAPGSPVRIRAVGRGSRVALEVRDFGPGVPPGWELAVLEPGVHDGSGGLGLGLSVCRRILAAENASLTIASPDPASPGCRVVVDLPAATTAVLATTIAGPTVPIRTACVAR